MRSTFLIVLLLVTLVPTLDAQIPKKHKPAKKKAQQIQPAMIEKPLQLIGIRPGLSIDSVKRLTQAAGVTMHEVPQDTLTHCFADRSIKIYVVDSIICRLTYMRMSFLFDGSTGRLRRFTLTPRLNSVLSGQDDDLMEVLLLYFAQGWGKPELNFDPPAHFRWRSGNIEVRGYIKRGYPIWVMEG